MRSWTGTGMLQWEHQRRWDMPADASEFVRADGALFMPAGFRTFSLFFRRQSQSAAGGPFELSLWTTPIFYKPLDEDISSVATAEQYLFQVDLETGSGGLTMSSAGGSTGPKVFGAAFKSTEPMGGLLFWQMKNTHGMDSGSVVGDIFLVPNHTGVMSFPGIERVVDVSMGGGNSALRTPSPRVNR